MKYIQLRFDRQKLIFNSAIVGIILLAISFLFTSVVRHLLPEQVANITDNTPIVRPFFWTSVLCLVFSFVISKTLNYLFKDSFCNRTKCVMKAIDVIGNELEVMIKASFEDDTMLLITMKNNKFYIGWAIVLPIPSQSTYLSLIPAYSGYRENDSKKLKFTTQYLEVYAQYLKEGMRQAIDDAGVNVVINFNEIITVSHFDLETYERFGGNVDIQSAVTNGNGKTEE